MAAEDKVRARRKAAQKMNVQENLLKVERDEDVLDTWFSSALQPFAVFGWPTKVFKCIFICSLFTETILFRLQI